MWLLINIKIMTQEEILEYNKLCAEFLGLKLSGPGFPSGYFYKQDYDWNWIMEVVEAIEKLKYLVVIKSNFCQIQELGNRENNFNPKIISSLYSKSKQEAVIQAINQFLIWYNNENKTN